MYRLPTEAEWEYAARAGTTTAWSFGDDEAAISDYAWWSANCGGKTRSVGQKRPNAFGMHDVHGNVWEWCADVFSPTYRGPSPADPEAATASPFRVVRGGAWDTEYLDSFRSAFRLNYVREHRDHACGFRVVRVVSPETTIPKER